MHTDEYTRKQIKDFRSRREFASFFFRWNLDKYDRLIFCIMPDVNGRNIHQRTDNNIEHYPRWVEIGFLNELMRLTDFVNSFRPHRRQRLSVLASLEWLKPSEPLLTDLWEVAKDRMSVGQFLQIWTRRTAD